MADVFDQREAIQELHLAAVELQELVARSLDVLERSCVLLDCTAMAVFEPFPAFRPAPPAVLLRMAA